MLGYRSWSYHQLCLFFIITFSWTTTAYRTNCAIELSKCALDEDCIDVVHHIDLNDTTNKKSLRFTCNVYNQERLNFDLIRPLVNLKELYVKHFLVPTMPDFSRLSKLEIWKGSFAERGQPIGECRDLETLEIFETRIEELPEGWLGDCTKLRSVLLEYVEGLHMLPARMLHSANQLRSLTIKECNLIQVPSDLISSTPELRALDLSNNYLRDLPKGFFKNTPHLERLKLMAKNNAFDAQDEFYHLTELNFLMLDSAHKYGKCRDEILHNGTYQTLPFNTMPKLEYLSLEWVEARRLCPEWGELFPSLKRLDLRDNQISTLKFRDVELIRNSGWEIDIAASSTRSTLMGTVEFTENDYNAALQSQGHSNAKILLNRYGLMCTSRWYWMIRTLKAKPDYISFDDGECWWADPPGSYNRISAPFANVPEWKLPC
ncbi:hypothetical protein K1T71_013176 [Dendrolimus kikuchii]|uniref:Uncharacterized protein n=1 Tax=Dendrolimus kikuchii TaxID=765133 RepID=A0ACC1CJ89_9NEOP|nr:hypothetical protein K1T71_013176 [Dendrolimus kikuchii]